jgi:hypothetical protein
MSCWMLPRPERGGRLICTRLCCATDCEQSRAMVLTTAKAGKRTW